MDATFDDTQAGSAGQMKFIVGGLLILAAVIYLIFTAASSENQLFRTVDELTGRSPEYVGRSVRVSGAVIGETINYDPESLRLEFEVAHVPGDLDDVNDEGGLAQVLHEAINDPTRSRMTVVYVGPMPDLLQHEAQAIMVGTLGEDGVFYAEELLLKCPTRYEEFVPEQAEA
jgi:cytochrome c-type biogenesis protein CcmE